jgi:hypothetical protein
MGESFLKSGLFSLLLGLQALGAVFGRVIGTMIDVVGSIELIELPLVWGSVTDRLLYSPSRDYSPHRPANCLYWSV